MDWLYLQQVSVVAHTTHNRLSPDPSPDLTPSPQPNQPPPHTRLHVTQLHLHTTSYSRPHQNISSIHLSIHPSIHIHPYTDAYTLTRLIVNKLLTLYIPIDILTFI